MKQKRRTEIVTEIATEIVTETVTEIVTEIVTGTATTATLKDLTAAEANGGVTETVNGGGEKRGI